MQEEICLSSAAVLSRHASLPRKYKVTQNKGLKTQDIEISQPEAGGWILCPRYAKGIQRFWRS